MNSKTAHSKPNLRSRAAFCLQKKLGRN